MSSTTPLTSQNFTDEVLMSETPVLVDFFATWCGPCRALAPTVDAVAAERAGRLKVCKLDIDQAPGLASDYRVTAVPTLALFKQGKPVVTLVGGRSKAELLSVIDPYL